MTDDLDAQLRAIEELPLEQRAERYAAVYDTMKDRLEQVDTPRPSA